ncbi:ExeA family protein [Pleionea litopenaei]|uniref:AAA family ATPase n=1 Tax=Pleionea litopenaei TaxID=3070815 RepID=A0AA51X5Z9_9GAMM|nr:AAA family ATPase [Pleionea sp. HL-JVS1]WMS85570.1 AAA family ATPase [Pleionea sp. HL-JVS1]
MYESFFGLKDRPFSIAPDPRFLFMSPRHKEALAHLAYGIRHGAGFVLLTGEVGTGKTTICRQILRKLPENTRLAFILNPMLNAKELLATLCDELGIDYEKAEYSLKDLTDNLTRFLLQCHQDNINVVLMIDEAQNLQPEVLEQIRLLTNLETDQKKLLQIILVGQPELQELLARKQLRQLAQRVTARYHLRPLNQQETALYVQHRLRIGGTTQALFSKQALKSAFRFSEGIPRLINNLCDRALMAAYSEEKKIVAEKHVLAAAKEAMPLDVVEASRSRRGLVFGGIAAGVLVLVSMGVAVGYWLSSSESSSNSQRPIEQPTIRSVSKNNHQESIRAGGIEPSLMDRNEIYNTIFSGRDDQTGGWSEEFLAQRWQLNYKRVSQGDFCQFADDFQLKCETGYENWKTLLEMNRPANLLVENNEGDTSWLTLHRVKGNQVEIETQTGRRWIKEDLLLSIWTRQYQMLWQAPPGYSKPIKKGDVGDDVRWLSERLAFLYPGEVSSTEQQFTQIVEIKLKDFQLRYGLTSDGIAGMNTLIKLNTSTTAGMPTLR